MLIPSNPYNYRISGIGISTYSLLIIPPQKIAC